MMASSQHQRQVDEATVAQNSSPAASLSNLTGALSKRFTVRLISFIPYISGSQPWVDFPNIYAGSFYMHRSQKRKEPVNSSVSFCAFGIFDRKSCS